MGAAGAIAGVQLAGAGLNAYGQVQQGRAEQKAANMQADLLEMQARDAIERGEFEAAKRRRGTKRLLGGQRALMAAQGLDLSVGTPADLQTETETIGALDALMIKTNAAREAWGFRGQAAMTRYEGRIRRRAANLQAFNTMLGGGASAAQTYSRGT